MPLPYLPASPIASQSFFLIDPSIHPSIHPRLPFPSLPVLTDFHLDFIYHLLSIIIHYPLSIILYSLLSIINYHSTLSGSHIDISKYPNIERYKSIHVFILVVPSVSKYPPTITSYNVHQIQASKASHLGTTTTSFSISF